MRWMGLFGLMMAAAAPAAWAHAFLERADPPVGIASYHSLRLDHINAALAYAAELAHEERLVPIRSM